MYFHFSEIRLLGIDAQQHVQLLARVRTGQRKVIELVHHRESLAAEVFRQRAGGIVDLERAWLAVVLVRTFLRAHQLAELAHVL